MHVRRGHVAPQNLFINNIIRRIDGPSKYMIIIIWILVVPMWVKVLLYFGHKLSCIFTLFDLK